MNWLRAIETKYLKWKPKNDAANGKTRNKPKNHSKPTFLFFFFSVGIKIKHNNKNNTNQTKPSEKEKINNNILRV